MKTNLRYLPLLALALILFNGCQTAPGSDPIVVRAEQLADMAVDTVDTFLKIEEDNRVMITSLAPRLGEVANLLRREFPPALQKLKDATRAYKSSRTQDMKTDLSTASAVVEQLRMQAVEQIAQAKQAQLNP